MMTYAAIESGVANGAGMLPLLMPIAVSGREVAARTPAGAKVPDAVNGLAALIVLGRDDTGRPHASWFGEADAVAAVQAAFLMGMVAIDIAGDDLRALAGKLPQGRLFASGKAFVSFVKAALFDQIASHVSADQRAMLEAGAGGKQAAASSDAAAASSENPKFTLPDDWSKIVANSLVLAYSADDESWFEAAVVETKGVDEVATRMQASAVSGIPASGFLDSVLELREATFSVFDALAVGKPPLAEGLSLLFERAAKGLSEGG